MGKGAEARKDPPTNPLPSLSLWPSLAPLVKISLYPQPSAVVKIKDGLYNFSSRKYWTLARQIQSYSAG